MTLIRKCRPSRFSACACAATALAVSQPAPGFAEDGAGAPISGLPTTIVSNPLTHAGQYYSGALQRALGMNDDSPVKLGGMLLTGGNYLASGGLKPHSLTGDFGVALSAGVDLEKLAKVPGADMLVTFVDYQGGKTNAFAGSVQGYDGLTPGNYFSRSELYEFRWRQRLFDDKLVVKAGKMSTGTEFTTAFLVPVITPNPNTIDWQIGGLLWAAFGNTTMASYIPQWPNSAWGATITFQPTSNLYVRYGLFDGNGANPKGYNTGVVAFPSLNSSYMFQIGQVGYSWLLGEQSKPGQIVTGAWMQTGTLPTTSYAAKMAGATGPLGVLVQHGVEGLYAGAEQRLWYEHPGVDPNGLIGWAQFGCSNSLGAAANRFVAAGLTYLTPFPGRYGDAVSMGASWSRLNPQPYAGAVFFPDVPSVYASSNALRPSELMFQTVYHATLMQGAHGILAVEAGYTAIPNPGARPGVPWANAFILRSTYVF
jgi:porin